MSEEGADITLAQPSTGTKRTFDQGRASYPSTSRGSSYQNKRTRGGFDGRSSASGQGSIILKQLIVAVTADKAMQLAEVLEMESQKYNGEYSITSAIVACVVAFPTKTSTYALLVGALASKDATRNLAGKLIVHSINQVNFGSGRNERLLLRFVGACIRACALASTGFLDVLDALVDDEDEEKEVSKFKESQIFSALSALPWFACSASAARVDETEDNVISNRLRALCDRLSRVRRTSVLPAKLASLPRAQQDRTDPASDRLAMGLAMATEGSANMLLLQDEEFDTLLVSSSSHLPRFGECEFPQVFDALTELKIRLTTASKAGVMNDHDNFCPTLLPLFPNGQPNEALQMQRREKWIERFLVREKALDVLGSYCPKAAEVADVLLSLNSPYVIVESVFSAMLQMPQPEHSLLYFSDVLAKLCMKSPSEIPAAIEDALDQILMLESEGMDPDALDRLSQWLVTHLLEFELDWPWVKWRSVPTIDEKRSVRCLVEQVLQRLDALMPSRNDLENPEKEIPQELLAMLPVKQPLGSSEYFAEGNNGLGNDLVAVIRSKPSAAQLAAFLEERAPEPAWNTASRARLVVQSALFAGKASFTHTRAALERVGPALVEVAANVDEDEEKILGQAALEAVVSFWSSSPAWAVFSIGALVDVKVVPIGLGLKWLAEKGTDLLPFWRRRAMEDLLARAASDEERNAAIDMAASSDTDDATDLWLSRRRV